jgi:hypothetical protein
MQNYCLSDGRKNWRGLTLETELVDGPPPNACGKHRKEVNGRPLIKLADFSLSLTACQYGTAGINDEWASRSNSLPRCEVFREFAFE